MPAFIVLTVIVVVVVLIAKSIHDAGASGGRERDSAPSPRPLRPRPQPRVRRPTRPLNEEALAEHVAKLRDAIGAGLISIDDAAASICRFTEGLLSEEAARELLRRQGAA